MYFLANSNLAFLFIRFTRNLHLVINPLRLCWCSLLLMVVFDTWESVLYLVDHVIFSHSLKWSSVVCLLLLSSTSLLPNNVSKRSFWHTKYFGYVFDWFIMSLQPHDGLLYWRLVLILRDNTSYVNFTAINSFWPFVSFHKWGGRNNPQKRSYLHNM